MLEQEQESRRGGIVKTVIIAAALVAAAAVVWVVVSVMTPPPAPPPEAQIVEAPPAPAPEPTAEPEPEAPAPAPAPRVRKPKPVVEAPPPPPEPAGPVLIIESDVPGASVFVNRQYLGTTPLRVTSVPPGRHQLNASADNQDGIAQSIDVAETGETTVTLAFKAVRLDASLAAVHKHGMGSCEGRLIATPAGIRYETANRKDAFSLTFADLEAFEIDYMKKELKVKQKGGKTWNFTDRTENADRLFVFHRDVEKARQKLAAAGR